MESFHDSVSTSCNNDTVAPIITCPAGSYCPRGTVHGTDNPCPAGQYCPSGTMNKCPSGTTCSEALNPIFAITCPAGNYCPAGDPKSPIKCPAGIYCPAGSFSKEGSGLIIDCSGTWSNWSNCSVSCGGGTKIRTYTINNIAASGGAACPYASGHTEISPCNANPCPVNCAISEFGPFGPCSATCGGGTQKATATVVTPASNGGTPCPNLEKTQPCNVQPCPVDCVISAFNQLGPCSATCGGGTQTATATVVTQAAYGGAACPSLTKTQACNKEACPGYYFDGSAYVPCKSGMYCPAGSTSEKPCAAGYYCENPSIQIACKQGNYCPSNSTTNNTPCKENSYCSTPATQVACPDKSSSKAGSTFCSTDPGYYIKNGIVAPCDAGSYCDGKSGPVVSGPCMPGYYCPTGSIQADQIPCGDEQASGQGAASCTDVPKGNYWDGNQSVPCEANYFCLGGSNAKQKCNPGSFSQIGSSSCTVVQLGNYWDGNQSVKCNSGNYCPSGSTSENKCQQGYYCPTPSLQIECTLGNYCPTGSTEQTLCPLDFYCQDTRTKTPCPKDMKCPLGSIIYETPPGTYIKNGITTLCDAGSWCDGKSGRSVSGVCETGYYCPSGSSNARENKCPTSSYSAYGARTVLDCTVPPAGSYWNTVTLQSTPCPSGQYSDVSGATSCKPCPSENYCLIGSTNGLICPSGSNPSSDRTTCIYTAVDCVLTAWNDFTSCKFDEATGSTTKTHSRQIATQPAYGGKACDVLTETVSCSANAGYYLKNGVNTICDAGYYCIGGLATTPTGKCDAGYYCPSGVGATLSTGSGKCLPGYYCPSGSSTANGLGKCSVGYYCPSGSSIPTQQLCPLGTYCPSGSASPNICPSGQYYAPGATVCSTCPLGSLCASGTQYICPSGQYYAPGATVCSTCPAGTYCSNGTISTCPSGQYYAPGAKVCSTCLVGSLCASGTQYTCPSGQYYAPGATVCSSCPLGSYCANGTIYTCPTGQYYAPGATVCSICPEGSLCDNGTINKCPTGQYYAPGAKVCSVCPTGTLCDNGTISRCPDGQYYAPGATTCSTCPAGSSCTNGTINTCQAGFYSSIGQKSCSICPIGTYSASGVSMCTSCATEGTTTLNPGSTSNTACNIAAVGYYLNSGTFTKCPTGKTTDGTGYTTVDACSVPLPGYYKNTPTTIVPCIAGSYCLGGLLGPSGCTTGWTSLPGAQSPAGCNMLISKISTSSGLVEKLDPSLASYIYAIVKGQASSGKAAQITALIPNSSYPYLYTVVGQGRGNYTDNPNYTRFFTDNKSGIGGGYSGLFNSSTASQGSAIIIAGGGGGKGDTMNSKTKTLNSSGGEGGNGGDAGLPLQPVGTLNSDVIGSPGINGTNYIYDTTVTGGKYNAGGTGGVGGNSNNTTLVLSGENSVNNTGTFAYWGGGGGGGYWGGKAGTTGAIGNDTPSSNKYINGGGGGGGGGSSFVKNGCTNVSSILSTDEPSVTLYFVNIVDTGIANGVAPVGYYFNNGIFTKCPVGSTTTGNGSTRIEDCKITLPGYFGLSTDPTICPAGSYCLGGSIGPSGCNNGWTSLPGSKLSMECNMRITSKVVNQTGNGAISIPTVNNPTNVYAIVTGQSTSSSKGAQIYTVFDTASYSTSGLYAIVQSGAGTRAGGYSGLFNGSTATSTTTVTQANAIVIAGGGGGSGTAGVDPYEIVQKANPTGSIGSGGSGGNAGLINDVSGPFNGIGDNGRNGIYCIYNTTSTSSITYAIKDPGMGGLGGSSTSNLPFNGENSPAAFILDEYNQTTNVKTGKTFTGSATGGGGGGGFWGGKSGSYTTSTITNNNTAYYCGGGGGGGGGSSFINGNCTNTKSILSSSTTGSITLYFVVSDKINPNVIYTGYYLNIDNIITQCPEGTTTAGIGSIGADSCSIPLPGYYKDTTNTIVKCISGSYCLGGSLGPSGCNPGWTSLPGASSSSGCNMLIKSKLNITTSGPISLGYFFTLPILAVITGKAGEDVVSNGVKAASGGKTAKIYTVIKSGTFYNTGLYGVVGEYGGTYGGGGYSGIFKGVTNTSISQTNAVVIAGGGGGAGTCGYYPGSGNLCSEGVTGNGGNGGNAGLINGPNGPTGIYQNGYPGLPGVNGGLYKNIAGLGGNGGSISSSTRLAGENGLTNTNGRSAISGGGGGGYYGGYKGTYGDTSTNTNNTVDTSTGGGGGGGGGASFVNSDCTDIASVWSSSLTASIELYLYIPVSENQNPNPNSLVPVGFYLNTDNIITQCPTGTTTQSTASVGIASCSLSLPGYYKNTQKTIVPCTTGNYCLGGLLDPSACTGGWTSLPGSSSPSDCNMNIRGISLSTKTSGSGLVTKIDPSLATNIYAIVKGQSTGGKAAQITAVIPNSSYPNLYTEVGARGGGAAIAGIAINPYKGGGYSGLFSGSAVGNVTQANAIIIAGGSGGSGTDQYGPGGSGGNAGLAIQPVGSSDSHVAGLNGQKAPDYFEIINGTSYTHIGGSAGLGGFNGNTAYPIPNLAQEGLGLNNPNNGSAYTTKATSTGGGGGGGYYGGSSGGVGSSNYINKLNIVESGQGGGGGGSSFVKSGCTNVSSMYSTDDPSVTLYFVNIDSGNPNKPAPIGYYVNDTNIITPCPVNTTTVGTGSIGISSCIIVPGYYGTPNAPTICPIGSYCLGGSLGPSGCNTGWTSLPGSKSSADCNMFITNIVNQTTNGAITIPSTTTNVYAIVKGYVYPANAGQSVQITTLITNIYPELYAVVNSTNGYSGLYNGITGTSADITQGNAIVVTGATTTTSTTNSNCKYVSTVVTTSPASITLSFLTLNTNNPNDVLAPVGYYFNNGIFNQCPVGSTTTSTGSTRIQDCNITSPGYYGTPTGPTICPAGSYCLGGSIGPSGCNPRWTSLPGSKSSMECNMQIISTSNLNSASRQFITIPNLSTDVFAIVTGQPGVQQTEHGGGVGGKAAKIYSLINTTTYMTNGLYAVVNQEGNSNGGGGYSGLFSSSTVSQTTAIVIAGGGGGSGTCGSTSTTSVPRCAANGVGTSPATIGTGNGGNGGNAGLINGKSGALYKNGKNGQSGTNGQSLPNTRNLGGEGGNGAISGTNLGGQPGNKITTSSTVYGSATSGGGGGGYNGGSAGSYSNNTLIENYVYYTGGGGGGGGGSSFANNTCNNITSELSSENASIILYFVTINTTNPNTRQTICSIGQYYDIPTDSCKSCVAGYYCSDNLITSSGMYSKPCTPGYNCPAGSREITGLGTCPVGTYSSVGSGGCKPCNDGSNCPAGSTLNTGSGLCPAGTYSNIGSGGCQVCNDGSNCPAGSTVITGSGLCPAGTYSNTNSGGCQACTPGSNCTTGSTFITGNGLCPAGTYSNTSSGGCKPCTAGYNCTTGSNLITGSGTCPPGTYSNIGSEGCKPCTAGYYCPNYGDTGPINYQCANNAYSSTGSSSCITCNGGTTVKRTPATSSADCSIVTSINTLGSTTAYNYNINGGSIAQVSYPYRVTANGGSGNFSYNWIVVDGNLNITIDNPNVNQSTFKLWNPDVDPTTSTIRCQITDTINNTVTTVDAIINWMGRPVSGTTTYGRSVTTWNYQILALGVNRSIRQWGITGTGTGTFSFCRYPFYFLSQTSRNITGPSLAGFTGTYWTSSDHSIDYWLTPQYRDDRYGFGFDSWGGSPNKGNIKWDITGPYDPTTFACTQITPFTPVIL